MRAGLLFLGLPPNCTGLRSTIRVLPAGCALVVSHGITSFSKLPAFSLAWNARDAKRRRPAGLDSPRMRFADFNPLFSMGLAARAQGDEFGARYWYSESTTTRSHNAQKADPTLGNPTSVLTYEDLEAHALELHGRKRLSNGGFIKGYAGLGNIKSGSFDDEDFNAGQVKKQDTTST